MLSVSAFAIDVKATTQKANQGDVQAQMELADYYQGKQDYAKSIEWYTKLANQGFAEAQNNLGGMYFLGQGVHQDYKKPLIGLLNLLVKALKKPNIILA